MNHRLPSIDENKIYAMPELPDITAYLTALESRILNQQLNQVRIATPFLLRTIAPTPAAAANQKVIALKRIGKRIAIGLENDVWLVIHLMIAGRLHWFGANQPVSNSPVARTSPHLISKQVRSRSPKPAPNVAHRCTLLKEKKL